MPAAKGRKLGQVLVVLAALVAGALPAGASIPRPGDQLLEPDAEALLAAALEPASAPTQAGASVPADRFELIAPAAVDLLLFTGRPPRLHLFAELETRVRASDLLSFPQPLAIEELTLKIASGDRETGLYYAKARYYDPELGLFLTEDPFEGQLDTPPSLHRYLYAYQNPTVYVDPVGRSARTRKLAERQEEAAASPEKAKALVSEVLGQGVAEALDPAIVAAVLQRTAGATRLANLIEDLGLSSPDRYKALSEEDQAEVRQTLQGIVSLVQDVQGVVEVIQEDPAKAGAQVAAFLKDQGRRGVELLLTAAAGDEQASFKVKRFLRGLQIDLTIGVLTGLSDEVAEAGAVESSEGGLLDELRGMFRKLRKGEGEVDLPEGSGRTGREIFGELPETGRAGDDVGNALGGGGKGPGGTGALDEFLQGGRQVSGRFPRTAGPNEVLVRRDTAGRVTHYQVFDEQGLPLRRVDVTGKAHGDIPTPHVLEFERHVNPTTGEIFVKPGAVRRALPEEIP